MKLFGIEISLEQFDALMVAQSNGKELVVENGKIIARDIVKTQEDLKTDRILQIKPQMDSLSQDFIQYYLGATIENIEERKAKFISLHNELRELLGKEPRIYK